MPYLHKFALLILKSMIVLLLQLSTEGGLSREIVWHIQAINKLRMQVFCL